MVLIGDYFNNTIVDVSYPLTVIQNRTDLSHLGATDYMWARVKNFDLGSEGENLKNAQLNFEHLGAMLRFQIKNASTTDGKEYTLQSVTVSEEGNNTTKILWDNASFNFTDPTPSLERKVGSNSSAKTVEVEGAKVLSKGQTFDAYMMVPASLADTDLSADMNYRFVIDVVVKDEKGKDLIRKIKIDPADNGEFMKNGFVAGKRYYFVISLDDKNLSDYYTKITVMTAGGLGQAISDAGLDKDNIGHLVVIGNIDQRDFAFMSDRMERLSNIDLSGATIKEYNEDGSIFKADAIPYNAFLRKISLKNITFPNNLKEIGKRAFYECSGLTGDLTIPKSVEMIDSHAFFYCTGLNGKLILLADGNLKTIGDRAFFGCNTLTGDLTIPNSVETIGGSAFANCTKLNGKLTLPANEKFKVISNSVFGECGFTEKLIIPANVDSIGDGAFANCRGFTGTLNIPDGVKVIGGNAFHGCSKFSGDLTIPNTVDSIGYAAFNACNSLNGKLTLPENNKFKRIGEYAFSYCYFTGELTIPKSITEIGDDAFDQSKFSKVHLLWETDAKILTYAREWRLPYSVSKTVPAGTKTLYTDKGWTNIE